MSQQPTGGQTIGCRRCGEPKVVYPPIPEFKDILLEPCDEGDSMESGFECERCGLINKIYWDKDHPLFMSASNW